jgi:putative FmdB family regulatory protein
MPTYTYVCSKCGTHFEAFASIAKKQAGWEPACPKCGSQETRQTFQGLAVVVGTRRPPSGGCCSPQGG